MPIRNKRQSSELVESALSVSEKIERDLLKVLQVGTEYTDELESHHISPNDFLDAMKTKQYLRERIVRDAHSALKECDFESLIEGARRTLAEIGVQGAEQSSSQTPLAALTITEAVNWAAKEVDACFYLIKPSLIVASWRMGCTFGKDRDEDGLYYLGDPVGGVASFHDPYNEIEHIAHSILKERIPTWAYSWSGVYREDQAFEILKEVANGGSVNNVLEETLPELELKIREQYMKNPALAFAKLADIFEHARALSA